MRLCREPEGVGPVLPDRSHTACQGRATAPPRGHGREPIVVWGGSRRQGPAGLALKGSPRHRLDPDG